MCKGIDMQTFCNTLENAEFSFYIAYTFRIVAVKNEGLKEIT